MKALFQIVKWADNYDQISLSLNTSQGRGVLGIDLLHPFEGQHKKSHIKIIANQQGKLIIDSVLTGYNFKYSLSKGVDIGEVVSYAGIGLSSNKEMTIGNTLKGKLGVFLHSPQKLTLFTRKHR